MTNTKLWLLMLAMAIAASGCASDKTVVFTTKTAIGIDMEATPPSASIAYDRVEGYFGPRFADGGAPVVLGGFVTDGAVLDRKVRQIYATGTAAAGVAGEKLDISEGDLEGEADPMFFGTSTTFGLKITMSNAALSAFTVGWKRKEVSVIPLDKSAEDKKYVYPPVLASIDSSYTASKTDTDLKMGVTQFFATGSAAERLSQKPGIQSLFTALAEDAMLKYREQERQQRRIVLDTLYCLSAVDDAKASQVWSNAKELKILDPELQAQLDKQAATPKEARTTYISGIRLINADSAEYTGRLLGHESYVCNLAGKKSGG